MTRSAAGGPVLVWPGKPGPGEPPPAPAPLVPLERLPAGRPAQEPAGAWRNLLIHGDNLEAAAALLGELAGRVDLIYLDPPFATGADVAYRPAGRGQPARRHVAYRDRWENGLSGYLSMLWPRLALARDLLAESGSLIVHVDPRASAPVRLVLDELFGADHWVNEIAWGYGGGGAPRAHYPRKHDTLLWYAKGARWTFHKQHRPYTPATQQRGLTAVKGPRYRLDARGAGLTDLWADAPVQKVLSPTARENLKYPTQKPEGLLRRILLGHSDEGDLVADFFCGSGTALSAAEQLGRRWIGCDANGAAVRLARNRLLALPGCRPFDLLRAGGAGEAGRLEVELRPVGARALAVALAGAGGQDRVEDWLVDWDYRGGALCAGWLACRDRRSGVLALESAPHTYAEPGRVRVAVKAADARGQEALAVVDVEVA